MKLRIHDNSIRIRLTRSEVARFTAESRIEAFRRLHGAKIEV
ncbi:MAG TPA: hypothetical protein VKX49_13235 [Bryobacteraceae bacterium]|nr:hypothetical protein [Bryobacteraceae bacterium]